MTHKYIVSVPGRATPLCIEADSFNSFSDSGVSFFSGAKVVARLPAVDLVAESTCLPEFPDLSQFKGSELMLGQAVCMASIAEPARGLDPVVPATYVTHNRWGVPVFWPAFAGVMVGFVGGVGLTLSHSGLW